MKVVLSYGIAVSYVLVITFAWIAYGQQAGAQDNLTVDSLEEVEALGADMLPTEAPLYEHQQEATVTIVAANREVMSALARQQEIDSALFGDNVENLPERFIVVLPDGNHGVKVFADPDTFVQQSEELAQLGSVELIPPGLPGAMDGPGHLVNDRLLQQISVYRDKIQRLERENQRLNERVTLLGELKKEYEGLIAKLETDLAACKKELR